MDISFEGYIKKDRFLTISEEDLASIYDLIRECALMFVTHSKIEPNQSWYPAYAQKIIDLCKKYEVDPYYADSRTAFFKAILGNP